MESPRVKIQLSGGTVAGVRKDDFIHIRGLKYAEAKRFEAPKPVNSWNGLIDCAGPAPICPQNPSRLNNVTGDLNQGQPMDEDCLNVTIAAPMQPNKQKHLLPVMVWFHGGAFLSGGGDLDCYLPQGLASRSIITVNVTYRLGIFGYLPIDDVAPANLGLLDQIEALRWVQKNISAFGGNPSRVTIVGQSAGALSVVCMMISDQADSLFQRAIMQSTPLGMPQVILKDKSQQLSAFMKSQLQINLHSASSEELLKLQTQVSIESKRLGILRPFWPRFGAYPLPEVSDLNQMITKRAGSVPIIISWTEDEATAFLPMIDDYVYYMNIPLVGGIFRAYFNWAYSDMIFILPSKRLHDAYRQAGGFSSTCCFRFRPQGNAVGATHCSDLPYLFGYLDNWKRSPMVQGLNALSIIQQVGEEVKNLWASFISGDALKPSHYEVSHTFSSQQI
ncbi:hypothetical protein BFJ69_g15816 [Fusarium oxysporum]|uniref:Carboxylic ester hydrolase n=1 Tax=Fusarium oxysporum TaxID=5507 RepID=A0A420MD45_FUSOX|nr:hypothetical protein BFJ69_g15816 [Fusarium oxysporum]